MKEKETVAIMSREIRRRIESDLWDRQIARGVMNHRRRRSRIIYPASSLVAAALVVMVFLFGVRTPDAEKNYNSFITKQIEGTYSASFENDLILASSQSDSGNIIFSDDLGTSIDEALLMRK